MSDPEPPTPTTELELIAGIVLLLNEMHPGFLDRMRLIVEDDLPAGTPAAPTADPKVVSLRGQSPSTSDRPSRRRAAVWLARAIRVVGRSEAG